MFIEHDRTVLIYNHFYSTEPISSRD